MNKKTMQRIELIIIKYSLIQLLFIVFPLFLTAQVQSLSTNIDTVSITLPQAEQRFLVANLQLLAARFNIEATQAAKIQAQLWNNPNIAIEQNIYNQYTHKYFDVTNTGNTEVQIQQLFLLAGKREKQIRIADFSIEAANNNFADLLRSLKFELRNDFYDLYYLQKILGFYDESIQSMNKTIVSAEKMYERQSILLSEVLRLKSLLLSLQNDRFNYYSQVATLQGKLHILLRDTSINSTVYRPQIDNARFDSVRVDTIIPSVIIDAAINNRPDLKNAELAIRTDETNLSLQKSLAVPDLTIGGRYSRAGSYIPDYYAITFSIDLPFWNRNQGNIAVAEATLSSDKLIRDSMRETIRKDVITAYQKVVQANSLYRSIDSNFMHQFQNLIKGILNNYEQHNISIIEFTDFFESYRSAMVQMLQIQNNRLDAIEQLNNTTGIDIIK